MIINNVELEDIDIYDLEVAEKYEKALVIIQGTSNKDESKSLSEGIRFQCNLILIFLTQYLERVRIKRYLEVKLI